MPRISESGRTTKPHNSIHDQHRNKEHYDILTHATYSDRDSDYRMLQCPDGGH
jgi:hypothetical protein